MKSSNGELADHSFPAPVLINICSTARGGSTVLDLVLGNGQRSFSCGEVNSWFRPFMTHQLKIDCLCGQDPCPKWAKISELPEEEFHQKASAELDVDYLVDSSKDLNWIVDNNRWAGAAGMSVVNILLWKDPVDLAYSLWKRGSNWKVWRNYIINYYGRPMKIGMPYVSVNFNEFRREPARYTKIICNFIGMPYFEGKECFWKSRPHHLFGSAGTRRQVASGRAGISSSEDLSPEFEPVRKEIEDVMARDRKLRRVIEGLREYDITLGKYRPAARKDWHSPPVFPYWYYRKDLWRSFRKRFPKHTVNNWQQEENFK
jgi:hypothetical protein